MNQETLNQHWENRRKNLQRITAEVARFKECDQCRSILDRNIGICPICKSYRFNQDLEALRATLEEMQGHPYPLSVGVLPRLTAGGIDDGLAD